MAELFETTPVDIKNLTSSIPAGTVVVQPVLLTNVRDMPNNVRFLSQKVILVLLKNLLLPLSLINLLPIT